MQFFFLLRLRTESADREILTKELVRAEIKAIHALLASGAIQQAWKIVDSVSIVLRFDRSSEAECRAVIDALPFNEAGILEVQMVVPVEPYLDVYPDPLPD